MTLVRLAIWLATVFFVVMLLTPLVSEMRIRLSSTTQSVPP